MDRGTIRWWAALLAGLALVASACAGATEGEGGATGQPSPTAGTETGSATPVEPVRGITDDNVVKLGSWIAQSGPLAVVGSIADAVQMRLEMANDAGGVNGYTFDFRAIDDQADPSQTVNAARQLWEQDEVFGFLHPYGSGGLSAVSDYIVENEIPTLFPFADARIMFPPDGESPASAFGFVPYYADAIELMMRHANEERDVQSVAVLHTNDPLGEAGPAGAEAAAGELGMEVVETVGYDSSETNYAPLGRRLAESGADALLIWSFSGSTQVVQAALESGYEGTLLLHDGYRGGFYFSQLQELPFDLDGRTYSNVWWTPVGEEGAREYEEAFTEAFPEGDVSLGQSGWVAASMFLEAVRETTADGDQLTWDGMKETLLGWEDRDIGGARGITYDDGFRVGATEGKVLRLEEGEWTDATDWTVYDRYR